MLAARDAEGAEAIKLRVNVPLDKATPAMQRGAVIRLTARLMPPAPPLVPGGYDFARTAWFQGLAATGSAMGEIEVIEHRSRNLRPPVVVTHCQQVLPEHIGPVWA